MHHVQCTVIQAPLVPAFPTLSSHVAPRTASPPVGSATAISTATTAATRLQNFALPRPTRPPVPIVMSSEGRFFVMAAVFA